jgi:thioredoxin 1
VTGDAVQSIHAGLIGEATMSVISLKESEFEETVSRDGIVVIDWWAAWCGPCRAFAPSFERVAKQYPDAVFAKVNTEENQALSAALRIRSIPTLMIFRDGIMVFNQPGMLSAMALNRLVGKVAELDMDEIRAEIDKARAKDESGSDEEAAVSPPN